MNSPDLTGRLYLTGQLLVRSGIEIGRLLDAMREDGDTVTANLQAGGLFLSRLLEVDTAAESILIAYAEHKAANAAALAARNVTFRCFHRGAQYGFTAGQPRNAVHAGEPAIRFAFPTEVLAMQQRRAHPRFQIPQQAPLHCEFRIGEVELEARVVDISLDGMGTLLYDGGVRLAPGMRLERVRILHPRHAVVLVGLEVRHVTRVLLPGGKPATRVGCRVVSARSDLEKLIRLFVIDL
jgi:c-di-GMP-binding flagellar brake protein YcgR